MNKINSYILTFAAVALICMLASGCAHRSIEYDGARYDSMSLGSDTTISDIEIVISSDGTKRVVVHGYNTVQSQAIKAAVEGAVTAGIKGVKGGL